MRLHVKQPHLHALKKRIKIVEVTDVEIILGALITLLALIGEHIAVKRANKYADRVVRRYDENRK